MPPSNAPDAPTVIPAQLAFLALYNPALGTTPDTFRDQILFYYARSAARARRRGGREGADKGRREEEENEKLRQVGLAQGMVAFARGFSGQDTVDNIETEKSRIVVDELEPDWWILASIDLTRIPNPPVRPADKSAPPPPPTYEYSAREVSPPLVLIQQLRRAHRLFLLHHGATLAALHDRLPRPKLAHALDRFWGRFCDAWHVLLHGSPAVDVFDGIKLAAGGELGMGVGEEEWGSGEREVLEDFAGRTDGLVDVVIARFGEPAASQMSTGRGGGAKSKKAAAAKDPEGLEPWMGTGRDPGPNDGVVFAGVGNISKGSVRDVSQWMEWIYSYGEGAYGAKDSSPRTDRRRAKMSRGASDSPESNRSVSGSNRPSVSKMQNHMPGIPRPIVSTVERSLDQATKGADGKTQAEQQLAGAGNASLLGDTDTWVRYLTLGYKSGWRPADKGTPTAESTTPQPGGAAPTEEAAGPEMQYLDPDPEPDPYDLELKLRTRVQQENRGHFLVGLRGNLLEEDPNEIAALDDVHEDSDPNEERISRIFSRTLHVEAATQPEQEAGDPDGEQQADSSEMRQLVRVVVYVHRPFIYAFLFEPSTPSLAQPSFYRHLHAFFSPLHHPLANSTAPSRLAARVALAPHVQTTTTTYGPAPSSAKPSRSGGSSPIYHVVHDPTTLRTHASVPNIPALQPRHPLNAKRVPPPSPSSAPSPWTRVEALHVHAQIIATVAATRKVRREHARKGDDRANRNGNAADEEKGDDEEGWRMPSEGEKEVERTCRTSRGWWVVWMKMLPAAGADDRADDDNRSPSPAARAGSSTRSSSADERRASSPARRRSASTDVFRRRRPPTLPPMKEAILIRQARDAASSPSSAAGGAKGASTSSRGVGMGLFGFGGSERAGGGSGSGTGATGPQRLAEGIGVDARSYVEGILGLSM